MRVKGSSVSIRVRSSVQFSPSATRALFNPDEGQFVAIHSPREGGADFAVRPGHDDPVVLNVIWTAVPFRNAVEQKQLIIE